VKKSEVVRLILKERWRAAPYHLQANAYAPINIALCKYWGKRDQELNLPLTSSFSISLNNHGATTELKINGKENDEIFVNDILISEDSVFSKRLIDFLDLFRHDHFPRFTMIIKTNIPIAAGLASSACGFAAMTLALDKLFNWQLPKDKLSILARLGSGSACRSIWDGFVEWQVGVSADGMDSYGIAIPNKWPDLCVGLLIMSLQEKNLSSREAMQRTVMTSPLYQAWPNKVTHDLFILKQAICDNDFNSLGKTAESNATTMHATMLSAWPPVSYAIPETLHAMHTVWKLRDQGLAIYFTQDAGPNIKLLFQKNDIQNVREHFAAVDIVEPFLEI
jgi:diphosphomevalonate decarboxylase